MSRTNQAPPWLVKLLTPLLSRHVARELARQHPDLSAAEIAARMRADLGMDPAGHALVDAVEARLPATPQDPSAPASKVSAAVLVAANLVPLYGVLFWDWEVFPLLVLFWAENVVVGLLNVARMLCVDPADLGTWLLKLFLVPFFCVHYGMFTAGHGAFVLSGMFGGPDYGVQGFDPLPGAAAALDDFGLWLPVGVLAASHLFSFFWNYLGAGEFRRASVPALLFKPYGRVVVLHLTIIFGAFAAAALGSPVWALVLLVAIKVAIDLAAHRKEHRP